MKKIIGFILCAVLLSVFVNAEPKEFTLYRSNGKTGYYNDGSTENSGGGSGDNLYGSWRSNNTRAWKLTNSVDGVAGSHVTWTVMEQSFYKDKSGGLPDGEDMYIDIVPRDTLRIETSKYKTVILEIDTFGVEIKGDSVVGKDKNFQIALQLNGKDEWITSDKAGRIVSVTPTGEGVTLTISKQSHEGIMYMAQSDDLLSMTQSGDIITGVRIYPFGIGVGYRTGSIRISGIRIKGYEEDYKPEETKTDAAAKLTVDGEYLRRSVIAYMKAEADVRWKTANDIQFKAQNAVGALNYKQGVELRGLMYTSGGYSRATPEEMLANLDENGFYKNSDKVNLSNALGTVCSSAIAVAFSRVMTAEFPSTTQVVANCGAPGIVILGGLEKYHKAGNNAQEFVSAVRDKNILLEAYAVMKHGDMIINSTHTRLISADPVVVYKDDGKIDARQSYVLCTENAGIIKPFPDGDSIYYTSWRVDYKYTFTELYDKNYFPFTFEAYTTGKVEELATASYGLGDYKKLSKSGFTGTVVSNYPFAELRAQVYNKAGELLDSQTRYTCVCAYSLYNAFSELNERLSKLENRDTLRYVLSAKSGPVTKEGGELREYTIFDLSEQAPETKPATETTAPAAPDGSEATKPVEPAPAKTVSAYPFVIAAAAVLVIAAVGAVLLRNRKKKK